MGIKFEKLKKKNPFDRPILVKQGQVRGNKNIFKVGQICLYKSLCLPENCQTGIEGDIG